MQEYYSAYAGVTSQNKSSEVFHESFGFSTVGIFHNAGYKFCEWQDVKWFEYKIIEYIANPEVYLSINRIKDTKEFRSVLNWRE